MYLPISLALDDLSIDAKKEVANCKSSDYNSRNSC